jgi:malonate transporter and related proteins
MQSLLALLAPDFGLIALGFVLARWSGWPQSLWDGVERITYFVLFPTLLFYANARAQLDLGAAAPAVGAALVAMLAAIGAAALAKPLFRPSDAVFGASFQCGFRFTAYIAFALAARLHGEAGTALMAVVIGIVVPVVNVAAVAALARVKGGGMARELATNPLILACAGGVLYGSLGLPLPEFAQSMMSRMGAASIVLGLIAVGAALKLQAPFQYGALVPYLLAVKLMLCPAIALASARWFGLSPLATSVVVVWAALPPASTSYILAQRMGGDGRIAAALVSLATVVSVATIPLWIALSR